MKSITEVKCVKHIDEIGPFTKNTVDTSYWCNEL